ncbi:F-box/WD repeat-containing protein lin-23 [Phtheirospermum japonicum]|uniref:F-box/WD repeat-containing protein lin-23 n=1 Tax=Phtheirospermum japonicum TaxID=374723 RepID=A0A830CMK2_9LAMI|nr:F-box/WD repeat-containing protein lin-23 [Phtheirospermum japonicum]
MSSQIQDSLITITTLSTPLLHSSSSSPSRTSCDNNSDESPTNSFNFNNISRLPISSPLPPLAYKSLAALSDHIGSVSCLSLCGEFILSASQGNDIIVWQQPDLKKFAKFGHGDGCVKALVSYGNRVFTAHQDCKIRVWKVSKSSENVFRLIGTLPTTKDYFGKFMKQSNYFPTRRHHKRLWIEHADSISCLAVSNGLIYSGSWDKTLKVWNMSDFKCLESIKAHDDAINGLVAKNGSVYSSSADGKIKVWGKEGKSEVHCLKGILEGHKDISLNSVVVSENGRFVYGGGSDGFVMGWLENKGLDSWKLVCEVKAHRMAVLCVCLMGDDDQLLCSGSTDASICVWRRGSGGGLSRHVVIKGHDGPVKCLQASPVRVGGGGYLLYSGSLDKSLRVWWIPKVENDDDASLVQIRKRNCAVLF